MNSIQIKNTNITLTGMEYVVYFTNYPNGIGKRTLLITKDKNDIKHFQKCGFFIFSAEKYENGLFYALTNTLKNRTINKKKLCIDNAIWHIENHINNGGKVHYQVK